MTGGAGFIGSNFVEMALSGHFPSITKVLVLDKLTYAGKMSNLSSVKDNKNFEFFLGDICDSEIVENLVSRVDAIVNFAAESHVDRSIQNSTEFIKTNILGTQILLDAARKHQVKKFVQISTDEVYGSILEGSWDENEPLQPNSPYSASKAAADLLVRAYFVTHKLNVNITRCSNNFGPRQDPEKLIPQSIQRLLRNQKISLYGDGLNIRDWLFVEDHCKGVYLVLTEGIPGEIYNIGGGTELSNLTLAKLLLKSLGKNDDYIEYVSDRPGHDLRYSVSHHKISSLGYSPSGNFNDSLEKTVSWYLNESIPKNDN